MEEILASIRRIIADDEAKPPAAEKPAPVPAKAEKPAAPAPAAKPAAMKDIPPSTVAPPKAPPKPAPPPAAAPPVSNSQDDIDALLNGLDQATTPEEIRQSGEAEAEAEVFELTDDMAVAAPPPSFSKIDPADDLEFAEAAAPKPPQRQPVQPPPVEIQPSGAILSRATVSSVESAFNALANTVLSNNARTLEDLVKEMLRPMLKAWLDDNLPPLVERIVKAEIERVSRGR
ncbi:MAG: DUF2497 domain-containing protein [Bradyrhizobium sp.]